VAIAAVYLFAAVASAAVSSPRLTPTAYRAQAKAICKRLAVADEATSETPVQYLTKAIKASKIYLASVEALRSPASFAALNKQLVVVIGRELNLLASYLPPLRAGALTLTEMVNDLAGSKLGSEEMKEEDLLWNQLGVPYCAEY
jgi:hypothetical protein